MNEQALIFDNNSGRVIEGGGVFLVFRLSWIAYASLLLGLMVRFFLLGIGTTLLMWFIQMVTKDSGYRWLPLVGVALSMAWFVYAVVNTWAVRVFTDDAGVWMFSGVFPWQRGIRGVQWRDVGEAGYRQGLMSWLFRSYSIRVGHRFTQGAELAVRHLHRGDLAVQHINGILISLSGRMSGGR